MKKTINSHIKQELNPKSLKGMVLKVLLILTYFNLMTYFLLRYEDKTEYSPHSSFQLSYFLFFTLIINKTFHSIYISNSSLRGSRYTYNTMYKVYCVFLKVKGNQQILRATATILTPLTACTSLSSPQLLLSGIRDWVIGGGSLLAYTFVLSC